MFRHFAINYSFFTKKNFCHITNIHTHTCRIINLIIRFDFVLFAISIIFVACKQEYNFLNMIIYEEN